MFNSLYEKFPEGVWVEGKYHEIETDFREWIRFSELIEDDDVPEQVKCGLMLQWYRDIPENLKEALMALGAFLSADDLYPNDSGRPQNNKNRQPVFSFQEDAGCIYSAFVECYGIDLQKIPYMHWWKFRILFDGLPENTEIKQRMIYRSVDLSEIKDKEERKRIKKIKKEIAIRKKRSKIDDYDIGDVFA